MYILYDMYIWLKIFLQISFPSRFSFDMTYILPSLNSYQESHSYVDISKLVQEARITNKNLYCDNHIAIHMISIAIKIWKAFY